MAGIIEFAAGVGLGIATGLVPGIHPNMVISALSGMNLGRDALAALIISLYPASLAASFVPSIFFGVPEEGSAAAALPGQRMVMRGMGITALRSALVSAAAAALLSLALAGPMLWALPQAYPLVRGVMGWVLLGMALVMLVRSRSPLRSLGVFALSGALGQAAFGMGLPDPFLPLFSGMFAVASMAAYRKAQVPAQDDRAPGVIPVHCIFAGVALGAVAVVVPGVGSSAQMASLLSAFVRLDAFSYIAAASAISVSQSILSLSASAAIGKERVGAVAVLATCADIRAELLPLSLMAAASLALGCCAVYLMRRRAAAIAAMDFSRLYPALAAYLACLSFIIDGPAGLAVLSAGAGLGWATMKAGVERTMLMGSVIAPTLLLLFRIFV